MEAEQLQRLVALGASNLKRGLHSLVATARSEWGAEIELLAALGYGRSYGARSTIILRTLPGILQSGLWDKLQQLPAAPTRALITDVGNDILYGFSPPEILSWVAECIDRLRRHTDDIVLTDLPMTGIRRLSRWQYLLLRSLFFTQSRIPLARVLDAAERLQEGLVSLAAGRGVRLFRLRPEWYGFDPIHIRPGLWPEAWGEILLGARGAHASTTFAEAIRLYFHPPEMRWFLGKEQVVPQSGIRLKTGGRVWLY